jgi:hypothetical protein
VAVSGEIDEEEYGQSWEVVSGCGHRDEHGRCSEEDRTLVVAAVSAFTACWLLGMAFALSL